MRREGRHDLFRDSRNRLCKPKRNSRIWKHGNMPELSDGLPRRNRCYKRNGLSCKTQRLPAMVPCWLGPKLAWKPRKKIWTHFTHAGRNLNRRLEACRPGDCDACDPETIRRLRITADMYMQRPRLV